MNPFLDIAESQISSPVKSRMKATETRQRDAAALEKQLEEDEQLLKQYRRWRRERVDALLAGPHGKDVRGLMSFMRTMTLSSAPALIEMVKRSKWIEGLSAEDCYVLLRIIAGGITKLREKEGLVPFDDALPDEPPKAYHQIRTALGVR